MKHKYFFFFFIICMQLHGAQQKSAHEISASKDLAGFAQASALLKARADGIHIQNGFIYIPNLPNVQHLGKMPSAIRSGEFQHLQKQYNAQLALEEMLLMKEFFALAQITPAEWQKRYLEFARNYHAAEFENIAITKKNFDQPLDEKLKQRIVKILIDNAINPLSMVIIRDDTSAAICWIMRNLLLVNQEVLLETCPITFEAIILHEIMHKLYDDPYISSCMEGCLNEKKVAQDKVIFFCQKWRLFCERRADIMAALKSVDHAKASIQFFSQLKQGYHSEYHPTHKERAAYLTQVLKEMESAASQTAAA